MSKDYLHKKWKTPAQLEAEREIPGKTREQLDKDLADIRRQVDADMKIWAKSPTRKRGPDRIECVLMGLALGLAIMFLCNGGCRIKAGIHIKSTDNDSQNQTSQQ